MSNRIRLAAAICAVAISSQTFADNVRGAWSAPFAWPLIAAHAVMTPDGRVLTYGTDGNGNQTGFFIYDIWDPTAGPTGTHLTLPNISGTDIFCSSQVVMAASGDVFIAGGDNYVNGATTNTGNNNSNVFSPASNSLARGNNMNRARWYSSSTTLLNGEIYIQGGSGGGDRPEIRDAAGGLRLLPNVNTSAYASNFPRNFLAPDGRVFGFDTSGKLYYVSPAGSGLLTTAGQLPGATSWTSSAVMYQPGRILQIGGASSAALIIDINGAAPAVTSTQSMSTQRQWVSATVLPDGKVLGTGGSVVENQLSGVNNIAEIWNPATGTWTQGASAVNARLYHSGALLLPDASVLIVGGGAPGPLKNLNGEIYYPPYLFDAAGGRAARPAIVSAPDTVMPGATFQVGYSGAGGISRVSLIKTGSITHSVNMDQRQMQLPFSANGALLDVQLPSRAGDVPPGYYLLFVLNAQGVPSVARMLRVGITNQEPPALDYTPTAGGAGGGPFTLACDVNEVLVGVSGSTATYVQQVSPQCVKVNQGGQWIGTPVARGVTGLAGTASYSKMCPVNSAISGFRGKFSQYVNQLDFECRALTAGGKFTGTGAFLGAVGPDTGTAQGPWRCDTGNPGYALYGRSGSWMDNFGVQCRAVAATFVNSPPLLANPGSQETIAGTNADLPATASDPDANPLTFSAIGLPPGLSVNAATGRITGVPGTAGNYTVGLTAFDGTVSTSVTFAWTITSRPPFVLEPLAPTTPATTGQAVNYTATVQNGSNPRFSWFFDDGTPATAYASSAAISHVFARSGVYYVTVTATSDGNPAQSQTIAQVVHAPLTANRPANSSNILFDGNAGGRVWVVNQDNNSVSVFGAANNAKLAEIAVGSGPRTLALAPNGAVWVANKHSATITVIDGASLTVAQTLPLPYASQPFGLAFSPQGAGAYVVLEAKGQLLELDVNSGAVLATLAVGKSPRHVSVSADGAVVYVSRFVTPPLPGESTAAVLPGAAGGEVLVVNAANLSLTRTITLGYSYEPDFEIQGSGIPNYLGAVALSPDGVNAWVPSKQDNVLRGSLRNGANLNFQNTVRAIASRIDIGTGAEDLNARVDLDNASVASAAAFDPFGNYLFVALETSREVAVVDVQGRYEVFRFGVGRAPQGLAVSNDGKRLYVNNFMDRTVGVFDLSRLELGESNVVPVATLPAVSAEALSAQVLKGKQFFYDARDTRLARDAYMSCASCHNDGGDDGRTWDLTGMGEGLRNTVNLRGRSGAQGFLHWSGNFDEVQDFEGQIRALAGGTGLMSDAEFNTGTRMQTLGDPKAGVNADLDALAAYVASLSTFANSPNRNGDGTLTAAAVAGREVFRAANCAACHSGGSFTASAAANLKDIGTIKPSSGGRLGGPLTGIDVPTLRDVWATAPYLHDGSAPTLAAAVVAHSDVSLNSTDLANLVAYVEQIGAQETSAPLPNKVPVLGNPGAQSGFVGTAVDLALTAADGDGDALTFSATGLPGGLVIGSSTGRITGTPTTAGNFNVTVTARDAASAVSQSFTWSVVLLDTTAPAPPASFAASAASGSPVLTWGASTDNVGVTGYVIYRSTDGTQGAEVARTPASVRQWVDPAFQANVRYTYSMKAFDAAGNLSTLTAFQSVTVSQAPPPVLTIAIDTTVFRDTQNTMTTPAFSTTTTSDLLVAFVAYDGPARPTSQTATVTGAGLTWTLVKRSNAQWGTSEIWSARATTKLTNVTVTSKPAVTGFHGSLTVIAFRNASGTGVVAQASAATGAPDISLPGIGTGNWVFAVGNDWDGATARTPVAGQTIVHQRVDTSVGDTFWVQSTATPSTSTGPVTIHDNAPVNHQWNYAAVEIKSQ